MPGRGAAHYAACRGPCNMAGASRVTGALGDAGHRYQRENAEARQFSDELHRRKPQPILLLRAQAEWKTLRGKHNAIFGPVKAIHRKLVRVGDSRQDRSVALHLKVEKYLVVFAAGVEINHLRLRVFAARKFKLIALL